MTKATFGGSSYCDGGAVLLLEERNRAKSFILRPNLSNPSQLDFGRKTFNFLHGVDVGKHKEGEYGINGNTVLTFYEKRR